MLAAADTYRAGAIAQLQVWADRLGIPCVAGTAGGDPAAVAFDAIDAAVSRGLDTVIVDTAGRLHTQEGLMEELRKVVRVVGPAPARRAARDAAGARRHRRSERGPAGAALHGGGPAHRHRRDQARRQRPRRRGDGSAPRAGPADPLPRPRRVGGRLSSRSIPSDSPSTCWRRVPDRSYSPCFHHRGTEHTEDPLCPLCLCGDDRQSSRGMNHAASPKPDRSANRCRLQGSTRPSSSSRGSVSGARSSFERLGVRTARDLLWHLPHRYVDASTRHAARQGRGRGGGGVRRPGRRQGSAAYPERAPDLSRRATRRERRARVRLARPGLSRPEHRRWPDAARLRPGAVLPRPAARAPGVRRPRRRRVDGRCTGGGEGPPGVSRHRGTEPQGSSARSSSGISTVSSRPAAEILPETLRLAAGAAPAGRGAPRGSSPDVGGGRRAGTPASGVRRAARPPAHADPRPPSPKDSASGSRSR